MERAAAGTGGASGRSGWDLTGNHYIAFPAISTEDGGILRINVLHRGAQGLLEWSGDAEHPGERPLLAPEIHVDGARRRIEALAWESVDRWIPRFRADLGDGVHVQATLCAPGGGHLLLPGAVYHFEIENRGRSERRIGIALRGGWRWSRRIVATARPLSATNRVFRGADGEGIVLELGGEPGLAALAVVVGGDGARYAAGVEAEGPIHDLEPGEVVDAPNGRTIELQVGREVVVPPGRRASVAFYLAAATERDGALARAAAMRRTGATELFRLARLALAQMMRRTRDAALGAVLNRNLIFCTFYAVGRAIDDDRLYPIVSRSSAAPGAAVFRERDALLWSLPALQLSDPATARETLIRSFEQFSHRPGAHEHYVDGGVLSPAFSLSQFCAYGEALDRYVRETRDESVLDEPIVEEVLRDLDDLLLDRLHPKVLLAATELSPSGDPVDHPYVTYDNVLVWSLTRALARVWPEGRDDAPPNFTGAGEEVASAIWRHCTAEVDGLRVLAWAIDLEGEAAIYDDPEGSLMILPFLGFCDADDPVWRNTVDLLHSPTYPFWLGDRPCPGLASRRRPGAASLPALCVELLGPRRDDALDVLRRLDLEGGVACETYDPDTGRTAHGPHHGAAAGLLAWTLWEAIGR
jgi:hypothetical protein